MWVRVVLGAVLCQAARGCTTIAVGSKASADGSTMVTHNADCLDCDFRIGKVPARDWPEGSMRPVVKFRAEFPRTISEDRGETWTPDNLDPWLEQRDIWLSDEWREGMILGHIPQVPHTFSYIEGLYGIINEKQVAMGESTCGTKFFAGPRDEDCPMCNSLFDISELSRVALERASTAREAIQIMGDLAVEYGFYGSEWDPTDPMSFEEAGEALMVSDKTEAWAFHVMSDDTTSSAVWVAQKVPDDEIAAVANQFIIREIIKDSDHFMYSDNVWDVAERSNSWDPARGPLDFAQAFTMRPDDVPHYTYTTRRVWRVFNMVSPSTLLTPYSNTLGDDYPFSIKPDEPVTASNIMTIMRDHYEGTPFDMTQGMQSGPYGDPDRYDLSASLDGSLSKEQAVSGTFERSIGLFRTSYSIVTQSRDFLPDAVGAKVWLAQYKPSASTYVPFYVSIESIPRPYTIGSLFTYTKDSTYWAFSAVGNWMAKARRFMHEDVAALQQQLEGAIIQGQDALEKQAAELVSGGDIAKASALLTDHVHTSAQAALESYQDLFTTFISKYHDGYLMETPTAEMVKMKKFYYPDYWMQGIGYFESRLADAVGTAVVEQAGGYDTVVQAQVEVEQAKMKAVASLRYAVTDYNDAKKNFLKAQRAAIGEALHRHGANASLQEEEKDGRDWKEPTHGHSLPYLAETSPFKVQLTGVIDDLQEAYLQWYEFDLQSGAFSVSPSPKGTWAMVNAMEAAISGVQGLRGNAEGENSIQSSVRAAATTPGGSDDADGADTSAQIEQAILDLSRIAAEPEEFSTNDLEKVLGNIQSAKAALEGSLRGMLEQLVSYPAPAPAAGESSSWRTAGAALGNAVASAALCLTCQNHLKCSLTSLTSPGKALSSSHLLS
ncbi:unnamed protein product [Chrysoparadoxa australica]